MQIVNQAVLADPNSVIFNEKFIKIVSHSDWKTVTTVVVLRKTNQLFMIYLAKINTLQLLRQDFMQRIQ